MTSGCRAQHDNGGTRQLREVAELLRAAAGVKVVLTKAGSAAAGADATDGIVQAGQRRTIQYEMQGAEQHLPALRELARAYQTGAR